MKIAIYGRTNGQTDINEQMQKCREYAEENNFEIAHEFIDDLNTKGKSFENLIESAAEFDGVVIQDRTRLARNATDYEIKMQEIAQAGIDAFFVN